MRRNAKRPSRAAASSSDTLRWLLVLGALLLLGWILFEFTRPGETRTAFDGTNAVTSTSLSNAVIHRLPPVPLPRSLQDWLFSNNTPTPQNKPLSNSLAALTGVLSNLVPPLAFTNRVAASFALTNRIPSALTLTTRVVTVASATPRPVFPEGARPVSNVWEAQLALARQGISPGSLDGEIGSQTRAALRAFQRRERLAVTGDLDATTRERLHLQEPLFTERVITAEDVSQLRPLSSTWLGKSEQDRLAYETILEMVSEEGRAHPEFVKRLNPETDWRRLQVGSTIKIPRIDTPAISNKAALVRIRLADKSLEAFDGPGRLLVHFPCSIARRVEQRPVGRLNVTVIIRRPDYTFNPDIFPESAEARELGRKLRLPPGPNNPVGVAWIGLSRSGYGIHGTPSPEQVGRTESHGCFRLANWNAETLANLVSLGTPVEVEP